MVLPGSLGAALHAGAHQGGWDSVFYRASDLILKEFQKISGEFVAIGLVKITFPVCEIYTAALQR